MKLFSALTFEFEISPGKPRTEHCLVGFNQKSVVGRSRNEEFRTAAVVSQSNQSIALNRVYTVGHATASIFHDGSKPNRLRARPLSQRLSFRVLKNAAASLPQ